MMRQQGTISCVTSYATSYSVPLQVSPDVAGTLLPLSGVCNLL